MNNTIFDSFIKGGLAVLEGLLTGKPVPESVLRAAVAGLLEQFIQGLPREIQQSFISQATLALVGANTPEQRELEFTAILAEIAEALKNHAKT
jgi:hypothetical protein